MSAREYPLAASAWLAEFGAAGASAERGFAPSTLKQALNAALDLGRAAGCLGAAMPVVAAAEIRLTRLYGALRIDRRAGTVAGGPALRVAIITELSAEMVLGGRWIPDLANAAGARALCAEAGGPDVSVLPLEIAEADPDRLLFALAGMRIEEAQAAVRDWRPWRDLTHNLRARTYYLDGSRFVNEPGPSLVRSTELIALACHGSEAGVLAAPDELAAPAPALATAS